MTDTNLAVQAAYEQFGKTDAEAKEKARLERLDVAKFQMPYFLVEFGELKVAADKAIQAADALIEASKR